MDIIQAMQKRHSVRQYKKQPLGEDVISKLQTEISECNRESRLHIQLVTNETKAFDGFMAHYGKFSGVTNYIALIGKKGNALEEKCGYYGETQGVSHKTKMPADVSETNGAAPDWFERGVKAALCAPTAMNRQKFRFILNENSVQAKAGSGFYTKIDLGIAKYHFEIGAGKENFEWG